MTANGRTRSNPQNRSMRRGAVIVWTAVSVTMLVGFAALAVDVGYLQLVKSEMAVAADAAALAGASAFTSAAKFSKNFTPNSLTALAVSRAQMYAGKNVADGKPLNLPASDITVGYLAHAEDLADTITTATYPYNAVRCTVSKSAANANGPVSTFFAPIWGVKKATMAASATAILDMRIRGYKPTPEGGPLIPVTVAKTVWDDQITNKRGQDQYTVDPTTGQITQGPDGIPEISIYPEKQSGNGGGNGGGNGNGGGCGGDDDDSDEGGCGGGNGKGHNAKSSGGSDDWDGGGCGGSDNGWGGDDDNWGGCGSGHGGWGGGGCGGDDDGGWGEGGCGGGGGGGNGGGNSDGAGNFGLLNFQNGNNSVNPVGEQIERGINLEEIQRTIGADTFDFYNTNGQSVTHSIKGTPGLKASLKDEFSSRVGTVVGFFIHNPGPTGSGSNTTFPIVGIQYGVVLSADLTGNAKAVIIQPTVYVGMENVTNPKAPMNATAGRVKLVR